MSLDPHTIRSQSHTDVGVLLERGADVIVERWGRRAVEEQPNAPRVHHAVLVDHLRDFLRALARSLAESQSPNNTQHHRTAMIHGGQRWETGWSLTEVVRDYQILRLVILDFLLESLGRPLEYSEAQAIGLGLDEAIGASVAIYVKSRDEYLRNIEDQRADAAKQVERQLRDHASALLDADRRKNEFLAMLAHELRNPLAPALHAVHLMKLKGSPDPELNWASEMIERQLRQMARMIDDLLDISRVTRGLVKLEKEMVDVATVVGRAVEMVRPLIDDRKQMLTVALPEVPLQLEADPARLAQVFANLLTNAAKYTEKGGQIWLSAERQAGAVLIKVRDSGIGITEELMPRIFDLYAQGNRSPEQTQGGLGIGLALVRRLVELHGGVVEAHSAGTGQGSEFLVRLPLEK
jgi:signal transduction histidine kinase